MDIRKLQRTIVDALEDVKAHDIKVFNTSHLTELFDRVIIASGTSNRQTKALASSVRDKVKEAGGDIVSTEGEDIGEWVLVDCGDAVVHILQPALRQYYNLEEIWGDKPVRTKLGATKPTVAKATEEKAPAAKNTSLRRSSAAKTAIRAAEQEAKQQKAPARKTAARMPKGTAISAAIPTITSVPTIALPNPPPTE